MPTLTQLEYILALDRTGHFGRAAEERHVAQPTLSAQIQKAETELGLTLFDRSKKPVEATPQGQRVIAYAQEVVAAHERLMGFANATGDELAGDFSLGIIPTLAPYVLPWFLLDFSKKNPKVRLSLFERPTDTLVEDMLHQRLDGAILATPLDEKSIDERVLFYDPFYVYAHEDEAILKEPEVSTDGLEAEKIWLLQDGHCVRAQVIGFCGLSGTHIHLSTVSFAAGSFETLRYLIDAAGGYTLVPETFARTLPKKVRQERLRPFEGQTPVREVSLVHPHSSWKTEMIDALFDSVMASVPRSIRRVGPDGEILSIR